MEFSWKIFFCVFVVNSIFMVLMNVSRIMGNLPARHSIIPGTTQEFLYFEDFWVHIPGDVFFVPFVIAAFVHVAMTGKLATRDWVFFVTFTILCAYVFIQLVTYPGHKPDFNNNPSGGLNFSGWAHLIYFSVCWAMAILCIAHTVGGNIDGPVLYWGWEGGILYLLCQPLDWLAGNFEPLKTI